MFDATLPIPGMNRCALPARIVPRNVSCHLMPVLTCMLARRDEAVEALGQMECSGEAIALRALVTANPFVEVADLLLACI